MENTEYKNKGSVVIWVLRNNLQDAFVVWMLAQQYDRHQHRKTGQPSSRISSPFFVDWLTTSMAVTRKTAKKRLEKAVSYGFLSLIQDRNYLISSHRRMVEVAMNHQESQYENGKPGRPLDFLEADREYTMSLGDWIDPKDMYNTVARLSAIKEIQAGILGRGRTCQGNMIDRHRSTMIRRTADTGNTTIRQYVLFDVLKMLVGADCTQMDAINAFINAEEKARSLGYIVEGRTLFHKLHVFDYTKPFLAIQIPNAFYNKRVIKEVPANRERRQWLCKAGLTDVRRDVADGHKQYQYTTWRNGKFLNSQKLGVTTQSPGDLIARTVGYINRILDIGECFDQILVDTGATGIRNPNAGAPRVWKEIVKASDATPNRSSSNSTPPRKNEFLSC